MVMTGVASCLLCSHPALVTDWTPLKDWLAVENCGCGGFFAWKGVWGERLLRLRPRARLHLADRVRVLVGAGREAWLATVDGTVTGRLAVHERCVDMPPLAQSPGTVCHLCSKPIASSSLVYFEQGQLFHIRCRSRMLNRQALEEVERAQAARARAESTVERSLRLVERVKHRRRQP